MSSQQSNITPSPQIRVQEPLSNSRIIALNQIPIQTQITSVAPTQSPSTNQRTIPPPQVLQAVQSRQFIPEPPARKVEPAP
jgi:hypothetical protein